MAATFAATSTFDDVETPTDCVLQSAQVKESVETFEYQNASGVTAKLVPGKLITTEASIDFIGSPALTLTAGAFTEGTYKLVSTKVSESNEDFPKGSQTYKKFDSAGA